MTPDQENQWKLFACIPRCIIKLAEINGHPVTADEFCSQFEHLFLNPTHQYGLLRIGDIYTTLKPLLLPGHNSDSNDYAIVESALSNRQLILLMSHVDLNPGGYRRTPPLQRSDQDECNRLYHLDAYAERWRRSAGSHKGRLDQQNLPGIHPQVI